MAQITDYASLSAAITDHTTRDDLEDSMDRFVQMAEQAMKRRLRSLDMETTITEATTTGVIELPEDCLAIKKIYLDDEWDTPLKAAGVFEAPNDRNGTYRRSGNTVTIQPEPDEAVDVSITYVAAFTPLGDGSNWLIEQHPDVYFYGTLAQAYAYYRDMEGAAIAQRAFENALEEVATSRNRDRFGSGVIAPMSARQVRSARC